MLSSSKTILQNSACAMIAGVLVDVLASIRHTHFSAHRLTTTSRQSWERNSEQQRFLLLTNIPALLCGRGATLLHCRSSLICVLKQSITWERSIPSETGLLLPSDNVHNARFREQPYVAGSLGCLCAMRLYFGGGH